MISPVCLPPILLEFCPQLYPVFLHTGLQFPGGRCSGCAVKGVDGMLWKCIRCYDYYLCSTCYMAGKHSLEHRFDCTLTDVLK